MPLSNWNDIEERELVPGSRVRFVHTDQMTFALWAIEAGASLPEHTHPHEQVANILEGRFELVVDGEAWLLEPGTIGVVPPNVPHSGRALTDCRILDVFYPVREDYR